MYWLFEIIIAMAAWHVLDNYTTLPWFWKFCIVWLIIILL